jgi:glutamyl-tRNA reductase
VLISLAVDFQAADVATRERFHLSPARVASLYENIGADGVTEMVLLATCNRTELYADCTDDGDSDDADRWAALLARQWMTSDADAEALLQLAAVRTDLGAARHALRVAAGLESQVLGDAQILGQFRRAHGHSKTSSASGPVLHRLFETALRAGKRVQAKTALCSGTNSVGAQAVALAGRMCGSLANARIAIVGNGKIGERAARQFVKMGARNIVLLNRSSQRSEALAAELSLRSASMHSLSAELACADIAVVATGAQEPIVLVNELANARVSAGTDNAPLLLIDLSMPRNIEAATAALPGITLVDLDAVHPVINAAEQSRRAAVPAAETIVEAELQDFADWLAATSAREAIRPLREALKDACRRELTYATNDEEAERISKRIVAKVMAGPMLALRGALARGEPVAELTRSMHVLFSQPEFGATSD